MREVRYAPPDALIEQVARALVEVVRQTLSRGERFRIALSGGNTPRALYERLAQPDYRKAVDWTKVHFFWGDERYVPHNHPQSNYRMAYEAWLKHLSLPPECVHPMPTDCPDPDACARRYEKTLGMGFGERASPSPLPSALPTADCPLPRFDLILLGMGDDGHTASLFPDEPALYEKERWVVPAIAPFEPRQRLTLTLPVLNSACRVWFLVIGEGKRAVLKRVFEGEPLPAGLVQPVQGELVWWLDEALR